MTKCKYILVAAILLCAVAFSSMVYYWLHHRQYHSDDTNCVASWNTCIRQLNYDADIVFFGDSHIEENDWQQVFPDKRVVNLGYVGEDTRGMLRRVDAAASLNPEVVVLMAGINGLKNQTLEEFEDRYVALLDSLQSAMPRVDLIVTSLLPISLGSSFCSNEKIVQANVVLSQLCSQRHLCYMNIYDLYAEDGCLPDWYSNDGLHLTRAAYQIWNNELIKLIE